MVCTWKQPNQDPPRTLGSDHKDFRNFSRVRSHQDGSCVEKKSPYTLSHELEPVDAWIILDRNFSFGERGCDCLKRPFHLCVSLVMTLFPAGGFTGGCLVIVIVSWSCWSSDELAVF